MTATRLLNFILWLNVLHKVLLLDLQLIEIEVFQHAQLRIRTVSVKP